MRAINLIPADARSGGGAGAAGRSGGLVYLLLGALAAVVGMVAVYAMTSSGMSSKRTELAQLQDATQRAQAGATGSASPNDVQQLLASRTELLKTLAKQRVDWASTMDAIARTLPADTTLSSLNASTTAGAISGAAPAAPGTAAASGPSLELNGCSPSQRAVALLIPRMRTVPGVQSVQLISSTIDPASAQSAAGGTVGLLTCQGATFDMVVSLAGGPPAAPAVPATPAPTSSTPAPTTSTPAATTSTPAASTPAPAPGTATTAVPGTPTSTGAGQ